MLLPHEKSILQDAYFKYGKYMFKPSKFLEHFPEVTSREVEREIENIEDFLEEMR